jgi:hypothetical protein
MSSTLGRPMTPALPPCLSDQLSDNPYGLGRMQVDSRRQSSARYAEPAEATRMSLCLRDEELPDGEGQAGGPGPNRARRTSATPLR